MPLRKRQPTHSCMYGETHKANRRMFLSHVLAPVGKAHHFHSQSSAGIRLLDSGRETLTTLTTYLQFAKIRWIRLTRQVLSGHRSVGWPERVGGMGLACPDGLRAESLNSWASSPSAPRNPCPPCSENLEPHCPYSENTDPDRGCSHCTQSTAPSASSS